MSRRRVLIRIAEGLRWEPEIHKSIHEALPYIVPAFVGATFDHSSVEISYESFEDKDDEVSRSARRLIDDTQATFRDTHERLIERSEGALAVEAEDPYPTLVASGSIVPTGRGKFVYSGEFLRLFEAFDAKVFSFCKAAGAVAERYPSTVLTSTLLQSGYLKLFPQFAYFVAPAHLDRQSIVKVGQLSFIEESSRGESVGALGLPSQVLAPTVCYHCFEARAGKRISPQLVTALNQCHRHELVNVVSLERMTTYWMRELVVFHQAQAVANVLDETLRWTTELLKEWNAWFEVVSASDPFFADMGSSNRLFQAAFALKRELRMPIWGGKKVAVASFNNHQRSLNEKLGVGSAETAHDDLYSGCVGWGYDRMLYSLMCQFGADLAAWPSAAKRSLNL